MTKKTTKKTTKKAAGLKDCGGSVAAISASTFDPLSLSALSSNENFINSDIIKPKWKTNKYPVDIVEYNRLVALASKPDTAARMILSSTDTAPDIDTGTGRIAKPKKKVEILEDGPEDFGTLPVNDLAPVTVNKFQSIPATGWIPPDCVCAAGINEVLVAVNSEFRIYTKAGTFISTHSFANFFSTVLPNNAGVKVFDPRLIYDHYANRYVLIVAATQDAPAKSWVGLAVSKTSNPQGAWWVYAVDSSKNGNAATNNWGDYPMLGFDSQAIYVSFNMFAFNGGYQYAKLRIFNKAELYNGLAIKYFDFWNLKNPDASLAFTVQPCSHYRAAGPGPAYLISNYFGSGNKLVKWTLNNPLAFWAGGAPTLTKNDIGCRAYNIPPQAEQKGSVTPIATNDNRLLSAVYQHAGGVKRIWTVHNTKMTWAGDAQARCAIQWYEVNVDNNTIAQQNVYGSAKNYFIFPSLMVDQNRNAHMVFSKVSKLIFAECRVTGRKSTDPINDMQNSALVKAGESAHTSGRFGDYAGMSRDGADPNRIYGVAEYAESGGAWGTYVVSTKY